MTAAYPSLAERRSANSLVRYDTEYALWTWRQDTQDAINDLVRGFRKLRDACVDIAYLDDALRGLLDEASNIQKRLDMELDEVGALSDEKLDVSEVRDLLAKVRG